MHISDTVWNMQKDIHRTGMKEHRRALISHNANFSAVAEHAMREKNEITWDEARVTISGYKDVIWKNGTSD